MSALILNGIALPVLDGSLNTPVEIIGDTGRAVDASLLPDRRAIKQIWSGKTPPLTQVEAIAFRDMILGRGHHWSFGTHLYSSKGLPITGTAPVLSNSNTKFAANSLEVDTGDTVSFTIPAWAGGSRWTISYYCTFDDSGWDHAVESGLTPSSYYINGAVYASPGAWSRSGNTFTFTNGFGIPVLIEDLWFCPFEWPSDWPLQKYNEDAAAGDASRVLLSGDAVNLGASTVTALGEVDGVEAVEAVIGATFQTAYQVGFKLTEA